MSAGDVDVIVVIDCAEASRSSSGKYCGGGGHSSVGVEEDTLGY